MDKFDSLRSDVVDLKNRYIKQTDGIIKKDIPQDNRNRLNVGEKNITVISNNMFIKELVNILEKNA